MQPWPFAKIGDVTQIVNGGTPKSKIPEYWDGDVFWITPKDMGRLTSTYVDDTSRKITRAGLAKSSAKLIPANSVILSTRAPIGHLAINFAPMATNQGCRGLVPSERLHTKFLFYFLGFNVTLLNDLGSGTTFKELAKSALAGVEIPLPPLPKQKRIVSILDEAFEGIGRAAANAEKNLASARELFDSYLNAIFTQKGEGWVEGPLSDLVEIKHGFAFKSEYFTSEGEYVLLTPGNFFEDGGYRDRGEKQKYYVGEIPQGYILGAGDFLIAMTEQAAGLLGSSLIVPESDRFLHNQRLGLVCPHDGISWCNEFFSHAFNTKSFRQVVHDDASGVKVRHTSPKKLGRVLVAYPSSLAEQNRIARSLDDVLAESERLQESYQRKLNDLAELKESILQKAFSGELTAQPDQALKEAVA